MWYYREKTNKILKKPKQKLVNLHAEKSHKKTPALLNLQVLSLSVCVVLLSDITAKQHLSEITELTSLEAKRGLGEEQYRKQNAVFVFLSLPSPVRIPTFSKKSTFSASISNNFKSKEGFSSLHTLDISKRAHLHWRREFIQVLCIRQGLRDANWG